jgi:hypothetical protein
VTMPIRVTIRPILKMIFKLPSQYISDLQRGRGQCPSVRPKPEKRTRRHTATTFVSSASYYVTFSRLYAWLISGSRESTENIKRD